MRWTRSWRRPDPPASSAYTWPTACRTSETKRFVEAPRSNPPARARPAAANTLAQRGIGEHTAHGGGEGHRRLVVEHEPGVADRLGHGRDAVGHDRHPVAHRLGEGHAEPLVVGRAHEDVGRPEVRLELGTTDRPRKGHGVAEAELGDEGTQSGLVGLAEGRPHEMQPRGGVVDAPEDVEHLDEVVRRLVRRDLADVEQVGPALARLAPGQEPRQLRIGLVALGLHVDQQRHHGGPVVTRARAAPIR